MKFYIVTGLSGAGKTSMLRHLEDGGCQCMDNLPPLLLGQVFQLFQNAEVPAPIALGVDSRSGTLFDAEAVLSAVEQGRKLHDIAILFLEADAETLIDRYKETRRDHPLMRSGATLEEAIAKEQAMLQPLRECASFVLDSSGLTTRELCARADALLGAAPTSPLRVEILSFGYKRGIPRESDLVFDVRFLPNPYYIKEIRAFTGLDAPVRDYVLGKPETQRFLPRLYSLIDCLIPLYQQEGKRRLMIAVGCTGGAHRSVAIAETLGAHLSEQGLPVAVTHRDLRREAASWPFAQAGART